MPGDESFQNENAWYVCNRMFRIRFMHSVGIFRREPRKRRRSMSMSMNNTSLWSAQFPSLGILV